VLLAKARITGSVAAPPISGSDWIDLCRAVDLHGGSREHPNHRLDGVRGAQLAEQLRRVSGTPAIYGRLREGIFEDLQTALARRPAPERGYRLVSSGRR